MAAVVGSVFFYTQGTQNRIHVIAEVVGAVRQVSTKPIQSFLYQREDCAVDWDNPVFSSSSLYTALEVFFFAICLHVQIGGDTKTGIAHDEKHFYGFIVLMFPEDFQISFREGFSVFIIICRSLAVRERKELPWINAQFLYAARILYSIVVFFSLCSQGLWNFQR